jgi:hypothetical protein
MLAKAAKPEDVLKSSYTHTKGRDVLSKEEHVKLDLKVKEEIAKNTFVEDILIQVDDVCQHFVEQNHILKPRSYQKYAAAFIIHKLKTY